MKELDIGDISVRGGAQDLVLENGTLQIGYDLDTGTFSLGRKVASRVMLLKAHAFAIIKDDEGNSSTTSTLDSDFRSWVFEVVKDAHGLGVRVTVKHSLGSDVHLSLNLTAYDLLPYIILDLTFKNITANPVRVEILTPFFLSSSKEGSIELGHVDNWSFFINGSASDIEPYTTNIGRRGLLDILSRGHLSSEKSRGEGGGGRDGYSSELVGVLYDTYSRVGILAGFISTADFYSRVNLKAGSEGYSLTAFSDAEMVEVKGGEEISSEKLLIDVGEGFDEALANYAEAVKTQMDVSLEDRPMPTLWSLGSSPSESETGVLKNLQVLSQYRNEYPISYIEIDGGYLSELPEWGERFPRGLGWLTAKIKDEGFSPGIHLAPLAVRNPSRFLAQHPDWVLKDSGGRYVEAGRDPKGGKLCRLDPTNPEVERWLEESLKFISTEWGFEYLYLDLHGYDSSPGSYYNSKATRAQVLRHGLSIIREVWGVDKLILAKRCPLGPAIGLVDGMRMGQEKDDRWEEVKLSLKNSLLRYFMHNRFWYNIAPSLFFPQNKNSFSLKELRVLATALGLGGGALVVEDDMAKLNLEQLSLLAKMLPAYGVAAVPVDLFEKEIPQTLVLPVSRGGMSYTLIGFFNWGNRSANLKLNLDQVGLKASDIPYHLFEFWEERYYGIVSKKTTSFSIPPHSVLLLTINPAKGVDVPQVVSASTHIIQGGAEVESERFDPEDRTLHISLRSEKKVRGKLFIYLPSSLSLADAKVNLPGSQIIPIGKEIFALDMDFYDKADLEISFG